MARVRYLLQKHFSYFQHFVLFGKTSQIWRVIKNLDQFRFLHALIPYKKSVNFAFQNPDQDPDKHGRPGQGHWLYVDLFMFQNSWSNLQSASFRIFEYRYANTGPVEHFPIKWGPAFVFGLMEWG